jgi:hypothetical protein
MTVDHIVADDDFMKCSTPQVFFYSKTFLTLIQKEMRKMRESTFNKISHFFWYVNVESVKQLA